MSRWIPKDGGGVPPSGEIVAWTMEEQWLLAGDLEVIIWATVTAGGKRWSSEWTSVILTAQQMDEPLVIVTLSEAREALDQGRHRDAKDLLDLLATM